MAKHNASQPRSGSTATGRFVALGEVLLRLSSPGAERLLQSPRLEVAVGGAEANVVVSLAQFGHHCSMLTSLPDQPLGRAALAELRRQGVDVQHSNRVATGRVGLYFLQSGAGLRPAEVLYDRAGSSFAAASAADFDWPVVLDGADWLHLSGVTPALGPDSTTLTLAALRAARALGVRVSFDCNYRAKLWESWRGDAAGILRACAAEADLLFADERALAMILAPNAASSAASPTAFDALAQQAFAAMPALQRIAATHRIEHSADHHELSGLLATRSQSCRSRSRTLTSIVDRIGSGDAFAAGLLHGLTHDGDEARALEFGVAAACLKHSIPGDANLVTREEVEALLGGAGFGVRR